MEQTINKLAKRTTIISALINQRSSLYDFTAHSARIPNDLIILDHNENITLKPKFLVI